MRRWGEGGRDRDREEGRVYGKWEGIYIYYVGEMVTWVTGNRRGEGYVTGGSDGGRPW